ncbi:hypothetical protein [Cystobacter ferrugineus]|uniref:Uncharacterized protein n=1 Tax=Cystobacter ferrugineus TaxID=83449 RepID=A0A1L9B2Y1_9BACT|nr:hypothetical protein [Cystobacter ferrugineus]OJH36631.1 hypothetical protein BON30_33300 [Cystobacter ferrugineus]
MSEKHPKPTKAHLRRRRRNGTGRNRGGIDVAEHFQQVRAAKPDSYWVELYRNAKQTLAANPNVLTAKLNLQEAARELRRRGISLDA